MRASVMTSIFVVCIVGAASADPVEDRQALMKRNGDTMKILGPMAKGEAPFDAAAAAEAFQEQHAVAEELVANLEALFPEGSTEGDTEAAPAIWEDWAGFQATAQSFREDAAMAAEAELADLEAFKTVFAEVSGNCGDCHETYRIEKE